MKIGKPIMTVLVLLSVAGLGALQASGAERSRLVYHVAQTANASDRNPGSRDEPFLTISQAARTVRPGDTMIVHEGIYRECVRPVRGGTGPERMITYQAAPGERVILRGSSVFSPTWEPAYADKRGGDDLVKARFPAGFFEENRRLKREDGRPAIYNPFRIPIRIGPTGGPAARYKVLDPEGFSTPVIGEVYVKGKPLIQARTIAELRTKRGSCLVSRDGQTLYVNFKKFTKGSVEVTVREQVFVPEYRGLGYIQVRGFIIEHAANQGPFPQAGMLSVRSGHHWIIEDNVIRYAATVGMDVGAEFAIYWSYEHDLTEEGEWAPEAIPAIYEKPRGPDGTWKWGELSSHVLQPSPSRGHIIRNNVISRNGLSGIIAIKADDLLIEGNVIEQNNRRLLRGNVEQEGLGWEEAAGIKLHLTRKAIIRNNLVRDNWGWSAGIWLDNNNDDARITGNLVLNNAYGVDLEINTRPNLVDHNIIAFSRIDGLSSRNSIGQRFIHNLVIHSGRWGCMINYSGQQGDYMGRQFGPSRDFAVKNNVFIGSAEGKAIRVPLPAEDTHNIISGNLIAASDQLFQLEGVFAGDTALPSADMVKLAIDLLTANNVPGNLWPDFDHWKSTDRWTLGLCGFAAFNAIAGSSGNSHRDFPLPTLSSRMDQFTWNGWHGPFSWPSSDHHLPELNPGYELTVDATAWPQVEAVKGIDGDYLGSTTGAGPVLPGPVQAAKGRKILTIWPKE